MFAHVVGKARRIEQEERSRDRRRSKTILAAAVAGLAAWGWPTKPVQAAITMTYTHTQSNVSGNYQGNSNATGDPNYAVGGNGTATITLTCPAKEKDPLLLFAATVPGGGIKRTFFGSSATASFSLTGFYDVAGAPAGGANGSLTTTGTYLQYAAAAGAAKITGDATSLVTANVSVGPFPAASPEPTPNSVTASAGFIATEAGNTGYLASTKNKTAVVPNGRQAVNIEATVTATRSGGVTSAVSAYKTIVTSWTLTAPVQAAPVQKNGNAMINVPGNNPQALMGTLSTYATSYFPDNLALDSSNHLVFSSVDPASYADPQLLAMNGPAVGLGNAAGLGFLAGVKLAPSGDMMALRSFDYHDGNFDLTHSAILSVNPTTGSTSQVTLSRPLVVPSAVAIGRGGFGPNTLVTELGTGASPPTLSKIDAGGNVSVIHPDLAGAGAPNPVDMDFTPASGFGKPNDLMILSVGINGAHTITNGTGTILRMDNINPSNTSLFLTGLKNPVAEAFGSGAVFGHPSQEYLYVLEAGDVDPATGLLQGMGTLKAYDGSGNATLLVQNIVDPTSLVVTDSAVYFNSGNDVKVLVPEPAGIALLSMAALGFLRRRKRTGSATV